MRNYSTKPQVNPMFYSGMKAFPKPFFYLEFWEVDMIETSATGEQEGWMARMYLIPERMGVRWEGLRTWEKILRAS